MRLNFACQADVLEPKLLKRMGIILLVQSQVMMGNICGQHNSCSCLTFWYYQHTLEMLRFLFERVKQFWSNLLYG